MDCLINFWSKFFSDQCDWQIVLVSMLVGLAIGLLIWAFFACEAHNRNVRHSLEIEDSEKGTFKLSSAAMGNFVTNVVNNFPGLKMTGLKMVETRIGLNLNISLTALPDSELKSLRNELRELLFKELADKLGVADKIQQINFEVCAFETPAEESENV